MNQHDITARLSHRFTGRVLVPGDDDYDTERRSLNPAVDAHPVAVVEAQSTADVRAAVEAARQFGLPFAVQATGHGTHVPADGGLLVKTGRLDNVVIDAQRGVARVRPGARWGQVLAAAAPLGLAPLCGSSPDVGVTGYTLGGGMGWLARKYGLAAESVTRAEVVLADGRVVTASRERNQDLFWALRGGGANFGVVTGLEFQLYPVTRVLAGTITMPRSPELVAVYRDWTARVPDEVSTALMIKPDSLVLKVLCPVSSIGLLHRFLCASVASSLDVVGFAQAAMGGTPARYLDMFDTLPDGAVEALMAIPGNVEIRHWGGAIRAVGDGPAGHRDAEFSVIADTADVPQALRGFGTGGTFLNFLADPSRVASAYTAANWQRLSEVKAARDPFNLFRVNHNITPEVRVRRQAA